MRDFNLGQNQLPQSSIGKNKFPIICVLKAGETAPSSSYSVFEIESIDAGIYTVVRPTTANLPNAKIVFSAARPDAEQTFTAGIDDVRIVSIEDGDTPAVGDEIGTKADSYKMTTASTGFIVLDFDSDLKIATVRSNSGGGGGSIKLVQVSSAFSSSIYGYDITMNGATSGKNFEIDTSTYGQYDFIVLA